MMTISALAQLSIIGTSNSDSTDIAPAPDNRPGDNPGSFTESFSASFSGGGGA